jgi:hypothetical protein
MHSQGKDWYMGPAERAQGTRQRVKCYKYIYNVNNTLHTQTTESGVQKTHSRLVTTLNRLTNYSTIYIKHDFNTYHYIK